MKFLNTYLKIVSLFLLSTRLSVKIWQMLVMVPHLHIGIYFNFCAIILHVPLYIYICQIHFYMDGQQIAPHIMVQLDAGQ
jgi:hypothetical protein